jgi:hypothetical protein
MLHSAHSGFGVSKKGIKSFKTLLGLIFYNYYLHKTNFNEKNWTIQIR